MRLVRTGPSLDGAIEILSGLSAGETVVVRSDKATVSVRVHGYEEA